MLDISDIISAFSMCKVTDALHWRLLLLLLIWSTTALANGDWPVMIMLDFVLWWWLTLSYPEACAPSSSYCSKWDYDINIATWQNYPMKTCKVTDALHWHLLLLLLFMIYNCTCEWWLTCHDNVRFYLWRWLMLSYPEACAPSSS